MMISTFYIICIVLITSFISTSTSSSHCFETQGITTITQNVCGRDNTVRNDASRCMDWCKNIEHNVVDSSIGRVRFTVKPYNHCDINIYKLVLKLKTDSNDMDCSTGSNQSLFSVHSEVNVNIDRSSSQCPGENLQIDFDYVGLGCYQIEIQPSEIHDTYEACSTDPFIISSDYNMSLPDPKNMCSKVGSRDMRVEYFWNITSNQALKCVDLRLLLVMEKLEKDLAMCTANVIPNETNNDTCNCSWVLNQSSMKLLCMFYNLNTGSYRIILKAYDPRCISIPNSCSWNSNHDFTATNDTLYVSLERGIEVSNSYKEIFALITLLAIGFVLSAVLLQCRIKKTSSVRSYDDSSLVSDLTYSSLRNDKIKIMLLYPRDCQPFMEAMTAFRNFLKQTSQFEVYDALDPDLYEEVAVNSSTWGLKDMADPYTKVILVASWCSLKMYDALLSNDSLYYSEAQPFDSLFSFHLNQLFQQNEPYKKIYVVRLDCDGTEQLLFEHISQSRIFTLPQCLHFLLNHLLELSPECVSFNCGYKDENENNLSEFQEAITNYSLYLRENPEYLDSLLTKSDSGISGSYPQVENDSITIHTFL